MLSEEDYTKVAKEALIQYPIICEKLVYLGVSNNVTFRVHTKDDNRKFLVKIHISTRSNNSKENIESELIWLEALDGDTDLIVPNPVRNLEGNLVTVIATDHNDNKYIVTVHRWVNGKVLYREPTSNETASLALLMASLHTHSVIPSHKREQSNWGIIHSNLHESNYVFYENIPRPIDFSNCGYGFYLFDMPETFLHLSFENRKKFIASYSKVRQLQENYLELLEAFFIWSIIRTFAFHSLNPNEHQSLADSFPSVIQDYFIKYSKGENFLLGEH